MNRIDYHSKRAMQEFHAGMQAGNHRASDAHLRLSALHMAHLDDLARLGQREEEAEARSRDS